MLQSANKLIQGLAATQAELFNHAARIIIPPDKLLYEPGQTIDRVLIIEKGVVALTWANGLEAVDVALIGAEGAVGSLAAFGGSAALFRTISRTELTVFRLPVPVFDQAMQRSSELRSRVFEFVSELVRQIAETAFVNARLSVPQRLARWAILATERLGDPSVSITHDSLAEAIGCRRAGITVALHYLEGEHLIRSQRGKLTVLDPVRLGEIGTRAKYGRLFQNAAGP